MNRLPLLLLTGFLLPGVMAQNDTGAQMHSTAGKVDLLHDWMYEKSHATVVWLDRRFHKSEEEPDPTPPSRFRVGLFTELDLNSSGSLRISPVADFEADVELPNLERRLKVFVSTLDPTALPGRDVLESDTTLRVGASRDFLDNWKTSAGIKTSWLPEVFFFTQWAPSYTLKDTLHVYPRVKIFWESDDHLGGQTSLSFGRWHNRWMFRQSLSTQWTQKAEKEDRRNAADPEHFLFETDSGGYSWDVTSILGYATLLLDERDYGRMVGGGDVARGAGVRVSVRGTFEETLSTRLTLFGKKPFYRDYLYLILAPEVRWELERNWNEEYVVKFGLEMLLWGDDTFR